MQRSKLGEIHHDVRDASSRGLHSGLTAAERAASVIKEALLGRIELLDQYAEFQKESYTTYLDERERVYQSEQHWPEHEFWKQRFQKAAPL